jgi:hypothetical protein
MKWNSNSKVKKKKKEKEKKLTVPGYLPTAQCVKCAKNTLAKTEWPLQSNKSFIFYNSFIFTSTKKLYLLEKAIFLIGLMPKQENCNRLLLQKEWQTFFGGDCFTTF